MALRFAMEWTLASLAFWVTRVSAINQLYFVVFLFLSGYRGAAGPAARTGAGLAEWLPFYRMLGFPVELLLGRLSTNQAGVWLRAPSSAGWRSRSLLLNVTWARGVRQYSAVGA